MTVLPIRGPSGDCASLESVISTAELNQRPSRAPDYAAENRALVSLAQKMATSPKSILQHLAEVALSLCRAHSAVISLLTEDGKRFYWPAIAGRWTPHLSKDIPRDFGPSVIVLDSNAAALYSHPERHFICLTPLMPAIEEALLIPFYLDGKPVGTVWIIAHDQSCRFDTEDLRVLMSLRDFASAAYALHKADEALRQAKGELPLQVEERTRDLRVQVEETKRAENDLRELTGHLLYVQDEERRHLARELHDGVGQVLAGLSLILAGLKTSRSQDHALIETISEGKAMIDRLVADSERFRI
jgi:signal transduction histidine kinase